MSEADIVKWDKIIRDLSRSTVRHLAYHQDKESMEQDIYAEGWIALLYYTPEHPYILDRISTAMRRSIITWICGVNDWNRLPRHLTHALSLETLEETYGPFPGKNLSLESQVIWKQWVERFYWNLDRAAGQLRTNPSGKGKKLMELWQIIQSKESFYTSSKDAKRLGIGYRALIRYKRILVDIIQSTLKESELCL